MYDHTVLNTYHMYCLTYMSTLFHLYNERIYWHENIQFKLFLTKVTCENEVQLKKTLFSQD